MRLTDAQVDAEIRAADIEPTNDNEARCVFRAGYATALQQTAEQLERAVELLDEAQQVLHGLTGKRIRRFLAAHGATQGEKK